MSEHSPLPWHLHKELPQRWITAADGSDCAMADHCGFEIISDAGVISANAALIVHSVNSLPAVRTALQNLTDWMMRNAGKEHTAPQVLTDALLALKDSAATPEAKP